MTPRGQLLPRGKWMTTVVLCCFWHCDCTQIFKAVVIYKCCIQDEQSKILWQKNWRWIGDVSPWISLDTFSILHALNKYGKGSQGSWTILQKATYCVDFFVLGSCLWRSTDKFTGHEFWTIWPKKNPTNYMDLFCFGILFGKKYGRSRGGNEFWTIWQKATYRMDLFVSWFCLGGSTDKEVINFEQFSKKAIYCIDFFPGFCLEEVLRRNSRIFNHLIKVMIWVFFLGSCLWGSMDMEVKDLVTMWQRATWYNVGFFVSWSCLWTIIKEIEISHSTLESKDIEDMDLFIWQEKHITWTFLFTSYRTFAQLKLRIITMSSV